MRTRKGSDHMSQNVDRAKYERTQFTKEEMNHLRASRHVRNVTKKVVKFTPEFKRYFYQNLTSGKTARQIFLECGIDPDMLGEKRIEGFCYNIRKQAKRDEGFEDMRQNNYHHPSNGSTEDMPVEKRIRQLEHELAYTQQEVEFLKKLQMADMEARRQWESKHQPK